MLMHRSQSRTQYPGGRNTQERDETCIYHLARRDKGVKEWVAYLGA